MKRITKTARRARASKRAKHRGIIKSVAALLKKANPAMKTAGASIQRLKGGVLKITPIKANRARSKR
jgi:hypothetical protein